VLILQVKYAGLHNITEVRHSDYRKGDFNFQNESCITNHSKGLVFRDHHFPKIRLNRDVSNRAFKNPWFLEIQDMVFPMVYTLSTLLF